MIAAFNKAIITQDLLEKTIGGIRPSVRKETLKTYDEIKEKMEGIDHRNSLPHIGFK